MIKIILISLLAAIVFGLVDGIFFLVAEETLQDRIKKLAFFDDTTAELFTGGVSASVSILIASYFELILSKHTELLEHPILDFVGIMTGTVLIILLYKLYKLIKDKMKKNK